MTVLSHKDEYLENIKSTQIPSTDYSDSKIINGIYYFVPDVNKSKADFLEYIYNK